MYDVHIYVLESYDVVQGFTLTLETEPEPTLANAYDIFKYARKQFDLSGRGFILILNDKTFYISKKHEKGAKNYQIFPLGEPLKNSREVGSERTDD